VTTIAEHFHREAENYRKLAAAESSPALRDQLLGYARQYDALASIVEEVPPPALPAKHQRQPMQQQQSKAEPDDTQ
jgi:hypothetical protein